MKYALIFAFTILLLFPLYWMVKGSFEDIQGLIKTPPDLVPRSLTLENYRVLLGKVLGATGYKYNPAIVDPANLTDSMARHTQRAIPRWVFNTAVIFVLKTALALFLAMTAGYAFAVYRFRGKRTLFLFYITGIFIGPGISVIPYYVVASWLHIQGNWLGVILPFAYMPVAMYMFRNYIETLSIELVDAARIDGASEWQIITRIVMPLCKPAVGVLVVLVAISTLQDYIWTLLMLPKTEQQTLMVGVIQEILRQRALGSGLNPIGASLAGGVIIFLPLFLVFLFCQRYFIKGLALGGVKG